MNKDKALREHLLYLLSGGGAHLDFDAAVPGLEAQKRPGAEKAVAAQALAADDAFEEKRPIAFLDFAESRDRRQGIADQLPVNRDQAMSPGQLQEISARGTVHAVPHSPTG